MTHDYLSFATQPEVPASDFAGAQLISMDDFSDLPPGPEDTFDSYYGLVPPQQTVLVRSYSDDGDDRLLAELKPRFIVLFEPSLDFVRRIEVYRSSHPGLNVRVYFMVWQLSCEEHKFLASQRKEKEAFERLIRERGVYSLSVCLRAMSDSHCRPEYAPPHLRRQKKNVVRYYAEDHIIACGWRTARAILRAVTSYSGYARVPIDITLSTACGWPARYSGYTHRWRLHPQSKHLRRAEEYSGSCAVFQLWPAVSFLSPVESLSSPFHADIHSAK